MRYYNVELDLMSEDIDTSNIWYAQGDIGGRLHISLLSNNEPINLEGKNVYVFFERKDGITIQESFTVTDYLEGKGFVDIVSGVLDVPGKVKVTVKLYERDILRLSFVSFPILCKKSISSDEAIIGTNQIDVIQSILNNSDKINELGESVDTKIGELSSDVGQKIKDLSTLISEKLEEQSAEVSEAIRNLSESVQNDLIAQDTKLTEVTTGISNELSDTITRIGLSMEELESGLNLKVGELSKTLNLKMEELAETLDLRIEELNGSVTQSLLSLDSRKIDYIVSEDEPDIEDIPLGTIWIKPNLSVGD